MASSVAGEAGQHEGFLERQGIHKSIQWGFVALIVFMIGNGMELGFISGFLQGRGITSGQVSTMLTVYGAVVAIASWFSGALADSWGPKRVMLIGFISWLVFEIVFLAGGVATSSYAVMLIAYALRGMGYPMFAYGFLVWITIATPDRHLGRGTGWFWFCFSLGQGVIGAYIPGFTIGLIGEFATMWLSGAFVIVAGLMVIFVLKSDRANGEAAASASETLSGLVRGITIVKDRPKVAMGGIVRIINQVAYFGIPAFFAFYMVKDVGFSTSGWQTIWGCMNLANVVANLAWGYIGDRIGRAKTVAWFGGVGCAVTVLAMYYCSTLFGNSFIASLIPAVLFGITLAAYVPLSAIMPLLAPDRRGSAVAILNLGAGLSNFVGPLVVTIFQSGVGVGGVMWVFAILYLIGFGLTFGLKSGSSDRNGAAEDTA